MNVIAFWSAFSVILQAEASNGCYFPGRPKHAEVLEFKQTNDIGKYQIGDNVTYQCDKGYEPIAAVTKFKTTRICQQDGTWSEKEIFCVVNIAPVVGKIEAFVKDTENAKEIIDGNYGTCATFSKIKPGSTLMSINLPQVVNLTAAKLSFNYMEDFSIFYNDSLTSTLEPLFCTGGKAKRMNGFTIVVNKGELISTTGFVFKPTESDGSFTGELCEVAIYSDAENKSKMCEDPTLFPLEQFKTVYYDHRCFYVALNHNIAHPAAVASLCNIKKAKIATIDSGRLNYLSTFISGFSKTFTYWVSNHSFGNSRDTSKCGRACCTALTEKITETVQVNCDTSNGYICEKELEKCGTPDQNEITLIKSRSGNRVDYACPKGFRLKGDKKRYCEDGEWTGKAPVCEVFTDEEVVNCPVPVFKGAKARLLNNNTNVGSWMEIVCSSGNFFPPNASNVRLCEPGGKWSGEFTDCVASSELSFPYETTSFSSGEDDTSTTEVIGYLTAECFHPLTTQHTRMFASPDVNEFGGYRVGSEVSFKCESGYDLVLNNTRKCQRKGSWSGVEPICVGASNGCYHPGTPQHTIMLATSQVDEHGRYQVGTNVTFICERGYDLVSNDARICQQNGSWSGVEPICETSNYLCEDKTYFDRFLTTAYDGRCFYVATDQITPTNYSEAEVACIRKNAHIAELDENAFENLSTFMSKSGYTDVNRWVSRKSDIIKSVRRSKGYCPALTMERRPTKPLYNCAEKCVYICEREFVSCGLPDQNEITQMDWISETRFNYSCPKGFKLIGSEHRDCVAGKWTGSAPSCEGDSASSSATKSNSFVMMSWLQVLLGFTIAKIGRTYVSNK